MGSDGAADGTASIAQGNSCTAIIMIDDLGFGGRGFAYASRVEHWLPPPLLQPND